MGKQTTGCAAAISRLTSCILSLFLEGLQTVKVYANHAMFLWDDIDAHACELWTIASVFILIKEACNPHQRTHSELCPQLHVRPNSPRVSLLWINDTASTDFGQAAYDRGRIDVGIEVKSLP
eukprot:1156404-Pelagomonas_calceolata.AAC.3